ncbi:MAG TPA: hypothetical protein VGF17_06265 [Phytomonospora sp.]
MGTADGDAFDDYRGMVIDPSGRFGEGVRRLPHMFFGVRPEDSLFPTRVLELVLSEALHLQHRPPSPGPHERSVAVEIHDDLTFTVAHDEPSAVEPPTNSDFPMLLGPVWWGYEAAFAFAIRTRVEVWETGAGLRYDFNGFDAAEPPAAFEAPPGGGTRVTYALDPANLSPSATLPRDPATLEPHCGPHCADAPSPAAFAFVDHRPLHRPQ